MRLRRLLALSLTIIFLLPASPEGWTADSPAPSAQQADFTAGRTVPASSLWIVVNLFSGKTSKQAEIVRETLARLGAGGQGIVLPYRALTVENMEKLKPAFLALSPNGVPWCRYKGQSAEDLADFLKALRSIIEDLNIPVIGVCGGHQAMALAFGGKVGPIRGREDDCLPYGHNPTERGRHYVEVTQRDPIFAGMGKSLNMVQNHYDEVKRLPPDFISLAANRLCPYQIMRHPTRPAYGVQAHCEYYYASRPDGGLLLRNFLKIARTHNKVMRGVEVTPRPVPSVGEESNRKPKAAAR